MTRSLLPLLATLMLVPSLADAGPRPGKINGYLYHAHKKRVMERWRNTPGPYSTRTIPSSSSGHKRYGHKRHFIPHAHRVKIPDPTDPRKVCPKFRAVLHRGSDVYRFGSHLLYGPWATLNHAYSGLKNDPDRMSVWSETCRLDRMERWAMLALFNKRKNAKAPPPPAGYPLWSIRA